MAKPWRGTIILLNAVLLGGTVGCGSPTATNSPAAAPSPSKVASPAPSPVATEGLLVLAASDLQFALPEIAGLYEAKTGSKPTLTLGSIGNFATQIENGAPGDLFFAADQSFIAQLARQGLVLAGSQQIYATGRIVLAPAKGAAFEAKTFADLLRPEVKKVAIANPEHAPYGRAAKQALEAQGVWSQLEPKLVLGENIAQTFQLVQTGNADAGIVALSVVLGVPGTPYTLIDAALHQPLTQEAAILTRGKHPDAARDFLAFVNGPSGRPVMKKYGFVLPGEQ